MNTLSGSSVRSIGVADQPRDTLEIEREVNGLHDRLSALDSAIGELGSRLATVMRNSDSKGDEAVGTLPPLTSLGTQIRSAAGRVEVNIDIVCDILSRLEVQ